MADLCLSAQTQTGIRKLKGKDDQVAVFAFLNYGNPQHRQDEGTTARVKP